MAARLHQRAMCTISSREVDRQEGVLSGLGKLRLGPPAQQSLCLRMNRRKPADRAPTSRKGCERPGVSSGFDRSKGALAW